VTDSEQADITWHRSTASGSNGNCVEAAIVDDLVLVRSSQDPLGSVLSFTRPEWAAFLEGVNKGEFTLDQLSNAIL
jgi:predicted secreted Zn-dependent protease